MKLTVDVKPLPLIHAANLMAFWAMSHRAAAGQLDGERILEQLEQRPIGQVFIEVVEGGAL